MESQVRRKFVLDENVLILAAKQEDEHGKTNDTCLRLFHRIVEICHSLVLDAAIWNKYCHQLSHLSGVEYQTPHLLHELRELSANPEKLVFETNPAELPEEASLSSKAMDNVEFIRRAIASSAILVTTDTPLRDELREKGVIARYGLEVLLPGELLGRLGA